MSFERDVKIAVARLEKRTIDYVRSINSEIFTSIIFDTPVDTGRLQGNWQTTQDTPAVGIIQRTGGEGAKAEAEVILRKGLGLYYLTNNLPYSFRIEFDGWSHTKAPQGMVRKNARRVQSIASKYSI